ncbi:SRPBCC family protein [Chloroflexota bacterium]
MKEIQAEIIIDASPERVWEVLTDFPSLPKWNPFMQSAEGELKVEAQITVYLKPPKGMGMTFKPRVLKAEYNKELRWLGHLIMPGLFDGEHTLTIEPLKGGRARFIQMSPLLVYSCPSLLS